MIGGRLTDSKSVPTIRSLSASVAGKVRHSPQKSGVFGMGRCRRSLTTLFALLSCGSTRSLLRGWDPTRSVDEAARDGRFFCADGLTNFPIAAINDDYCDCNDGSDEPGTAACSFTSVTFFCRNVGWRPQKLRSSRVDDGICDCCDGSDEATVQCRSECRQLAEVGMALA